MIAAGGGSAPGVYEVSLPDGGGLSAQRRAWREKLRLRAAQNVLPRCRVASWAGICLGHHESVGEQRLGRRRNGNQDLEPVLAVVFEVIERRYRDGLTLAEVAHAVHVSPAHLTTTVRRTTGRTVGEWIIYRRIVEARRLLIETRLPIAEVAASVGYRDPVLFRRQFAARHAMTPGRWRAAASGRTKDRPSIPTDPH